MKITDLKVEVVKIPLKKPFSIAFAVQNVLSVCAML